MPAQMFALCLKYPFMIFLFLRDVSADPFPMTFGMTLYPRHNIDVNKFPSAGLIHSDKKMDIGNRLMKW